jgi:hypothetical protein
METRSTRAGVRREDRLDLTTNLAEPPVKSFEESVDTHLAKKKKSEERVEREKNFDKDIKESDEKREREVEKMHKDVEKAAKDTEDARKKEKDSKDAQEKGKDSKEEKEQKTGEVPAQRSASAAGPDAVLM